MRINNHCTIFIICCDPGAASDMSVITSNLIKKSTYKISIITTLYSKPYFKQLGIDTKLITDYKNIQNVENLFIGKKKIFPWPDLIFTGTSWGEKFELLFIDFANKQGIPSIAWMDNWSNYSDRFITNSTTKRIYPSIIAVTDEYARSQAIAEGIPENILVDTGAAHFNILNKLYLRGSKKKIELLKHEILKEKDELLVLFVSQCISETQNLEFSFSENDVYEDIVQSLIQISERTEVKFCLAIRLHPKEFIKKYNNFEHNSVRVIIAENSNSYIWCLAADLVIGINTILLVDSSLLGKQAISIQYKRSETDLLPSNKTGLTLPVYKKRELKNTIENALFNKNHLKYSFKNNIKSDIYNKKEKLTKLIGNIVNKT